MAHMEEVLSGAGEHAGKGAKLFKNKKFLIVAGVVAALGLFVYMKNKNSGSGGTAAFSNYPAPPQESGNIPTNVGSVLPDTTGSSNDPYSVDLGNGAAPVMDIPGYQVPVSNIPQQQLDPIRSVSDIHYATGVIHSAAAEANYLNGSLDVHQAEAGLGYGGITNGTAASLAAGQTVRDKIATGGSSYVSAEIARANQVIANRQAEGQDTSLQQKYIQDVQTTQRVQTQINDYGTQYNAAIARGDMAAATAAHNAANAARASIGQATYYDSNTDHHSSSSSSSSHSSSSSSNHPTVSATKSSSDMSSYRTPATASSAQRALAAKYGMTL